MENGHRIIVGTIIMPSFLEYTGGGGKWRLRLQKVI